MDLDNLEHNTRDGLHIASLAGAWIVAVAGFGGMRDHDGKLSFAPRLPKQLTRLAFGVWFRDRRLRVEVTHTNPESVSHPIPEIIESEAATQPAGRSPTARGVSG
jgi:alpha,alpha-trehalose phosphorylase